MKYKIWARELTTGGLHLSMQESGVTSSTSRGPSGRLGVSNGKAILAGQFCFNCFFDRNRKQEKENKIEMKN